MYVISNVLSVPGLSLSTSLAAAAALKPAPHLNLRNFSAHTDVKIAFGMLQPGSISRGVSANPHQP